jgi:hypothetical protein
VYFTGIKLVAGLLIESLVLTQQAVIDLIHGFMSLRDASRQPLVPPHFTVLVNVRG